MKVRKWSNMTGMEELCSTERFVLLSPPAEAQGCTFPSQQGAAMPAVAKAC